MDSAAFSWRVVTARFGAMSRTLQARPEVLDGSEHCSERGCRRSTPGRRPAPRCAWAGSPAARPCPTRARGRRATRGRGRPRPRAAPSASGPAGPAPAAARAPGPARGRRPPRARRPPRPRTPSSRSRRANGRALRGRPAPLASPFSGRPRRLLVRADGRAVQDRHAQRDAAPLRHLQQALPDAEMAPAVEGLRRPPPRAEFGRDGAPRGAVAVPPDDRLDRAAQVVVLRLAARPDRLDQRRRPLPPRVRQNARPMLVRHAPKMGTELKT